MIINLTPGHGDWAALIPTIGTELSKYPKLEEISLRIMVFGKGPKELWSAAPVFEVAKTNRSSLCVELIDLEAPRWQRAQSRVEHDLIEKAIYKLAKQKIGKNPEVCVSTWGNISSLSVC